MKMYLLRLELKFVPRGPINISLDFGRQAIAWTNDGILYWRIYASLGLKLFKITSLASWKL